MAHKETNPFRRLAMETKIISQLYLAPTEKHREDQSATKPDAQEDLTEKTVDPPVADRNKLSFTDESNKPDIKQSQKKGQQDPDHHSLEKRKSTPKNHKLCTPALTGINNKNLIGIITSWTK